MLSPPARIAVSAANPSVRRGLAALVRSSPSFELVSEEPDVVLRELDNGEPLGAVEGWTLVLSGRVPDPGELALARGWLPRDLDDEDILIALEAVCRGLVVQVPGLQAPPEPAESPLTARELDVLRLMAEGLANKQISSRLGISDNTVKFHLSSIFTKLAANSRTEAVTAGLRKGLILI